MAFKLENNSEITVGILADLYIRIDLVHKALCGSGLAQSLNLNAGVPKSSVVEI